MSSSTGVSRVASLVGQEIDGRYRVDSVLARGGMGVVLRGTHLVLGQSVAIKVMLDATMRDANLRERFLREARILAQVRSPAIASIFDAGLLSDGTPYLVMELLEGEDLETILARGVLPIEQAAKILAQVCEGLAEAHEQGIVHRDLKPANVFVVQKTNGEKVSKIIDFGISKRLGDASEQTGVHTLVGSPYYMAPEQVYAARDIDHRADIWSLGVILYRLVLGAQPFEAGTLPAILIRIKSATPTFPGTLDRAFADIVKKCLEKDRGKRYETALELREDLVRFVDDGAKPGSRPFSSNRTSRSQVARAPLASTPPSGPVADQGVTSEWHSPETITAEVSAVLLDTGEISSTHLEDDLPSPEHGSPALEGDRTSPSMPAMPTEADDVPADRKKTIVRLRAPEPTVEQKTDLEPAPPPSAPSSTDFRAAPAGHGSFGWQPVWEGEAPRSVAAVEPVRRVPIAARVDFQLEKAGPWIVGGAVAVAIVAAMVVLAAQCGESPAPPPQPTRTVPKTSASASAPHSPPALIVLSPPPAEPPEASDASDASPHSR